QRGGIVIFITNAPPPGGGGRTFLDRLAGASGGCGAIVSLGGVTRNLIAARAGQKGFHIRPERDRPIFAGLQVTSVPLELADFSVCSGLFDDTSEAPQDYEDLIGRMRKQELPMVCANPDVVVERGDRLVYCAGAIADLYALGGGQVLYAGKPYRP